MLVNNEVRPIIAISKSEFTTSLQIKESFTMYSLKIKSLSIGKKDLDIFYLGVPRAIEL